MLWLDYKIQQPEDVVKFALPLNRDTEHLYYNTFLVIDTMVKTEPRVFQISKINRVASPGVAIFTCAQELANQHTLKADYDDDGNVVAWWADWKESNVEPIQAIPDSNLVQQEQISDPSPATQITCSGKQQIKIGGSYKTFTVTYVGSDDQTSYPETGEWIFTIDGEDITDILTINHTDQANKIKVKFNGGDEYIGKILTITHKSGDLVASLRIEILPL